MFCTLDRGSCRCRDGCTCASILDLLIAGQIRYSLLVGSILLVVLWSSVPAERSFKKVVRQACLNGLFLHGTALIQIFRHRLQYYHLAVIEQLVILTIVPLGCTLLRPGWRAFRLFEKSVVIASALFAMGWSIYLELLRPHTMSLEMECRMIWLTEIQRTGPQASERVQRTLSLDSDMIKAFYVYQFFVNALATALSSVGLVFLALSFLCVHHGRGSLLDDKFVIRCWLLLGFGTSMAHQYSVIKHFQHYTDDSENGWGFGQIYPLLAILLPIGDFATDITYEEFCQGLPFSMIYPCYTYRLDKLTNLSGVKLSVEDMVRCPIAGVAGLLTFITTIKHLPDVFETLMDLVNVTSDNLTNVVTILGVAFIIFPGILLFSIGCGLGAIVAGGLGYMLGTYLVSDCRWLWGVWSARSAPARGLHTTRSL